MSWTALISTEAAAAPEVIPVEVVVLRPGPAWKPDVGPEGQDLAAHFAYVEKALGSGAMYGYGPALDEPAGYYLVDPDAADRWLARDPGLASGVLVVDARFTWGVAMNGFGPVQPGASYTFVRYGQGPRYVAGKTVFEQDVAAHLAYVGERFAAGELVAGGPILPAAAEGLYLLRVTDPGRVDAIVAADPGVTSGVFAPQPRRWAAMAMAPLGR